MHWYELNEEIILIAFLCFWLAVLGTVMGSFLLCAVSRWASGEKNPFAGRSRCDSCGHELSAVDLIPIFGYLLRRGKCHYCGKGIPVRCLMAEIAGAILFACAGWSFGITLELGQYLIWTSLLFALSLTDLFRRIIPDRFLLAMAANRIFWFFVLGQGISVALKSLIACAVPACLLGLVLAWERCAKREVMGGGDIKLLFALALYMDLPRMLLTLIAGCLSGIVMVCLSGGKKGEAIPFGPFLAAGAFLTICFGGPLIKWYFSLL